ncbi:carboxypeptidase M32, partial [bacterium]|nr:carboxypeptidase M32 [bacterium]
MLKQLLRLYQERVMLDSVQSVIGWDQETYMPPGAIQARARQSAYLSEKSHAIMSSDGFRAAIETLVDVSTGQVSPDVVDPLHRRMISEAYREWKYAVSLPSGLVCELAELTSQAQHEWQIAKKNNNYSHFEPYLRRVVHLTHRKIDYLGYSERPYDALLDIFEPGVSTTHLTALFSDLKQLTIRTIQTQKNADQNAQFPEGPYDLAQQQELSLAVLKLMGFDFNRGRLDISAHPFSTSFHPTDCRITTRYHDGDLMDSLSSTMHEGGHALYEQGIPTDYFGTPIGTSISLGIHESQSRMWENMVGKSRAFCEGIFPKVVAHFPQIRPLGADGLYHAVNRVSPSLIRVDADEVTYNLHVLIRFELEQLLFSNTITTQELP